jgi:hypothetical protein
LAYGFSIVERIEVPTSKAVTVPCARMAKPIIGIRSFRAAGLFGESLVLSVQERKAVPRIPDA